MDQMGHSSIRFSVPKQLPRRPVRPSRALVTVPSTRRWTRFVVVATIGLALASLAAPTASAQTAPGPSTTAAPTTTVVRTSTTAAPTSTAATSTSTTTAPTSTTTLGSTTTAPSTTLLGSINDDFANATVITSLPFSTVEDTGQATFEPTDPGGCSNNGSVWFAFTPPSNMTIGADTFGSTYDTVLSAWTGTQGNLSRVACNDDPVGWQSEIDFQATGGTTYYFMVASCCGDGGSGGGVLHFSVNQVLRPGNDDFANATSVPSMPFSDAADLFAASREPSEPSPPCASLENTVWYSFTPSVTETVSVSIDQYWQGIGVYTGTSLTNLSPVACARYYFEPASFRVQANTTYYFQVGLWLTGGPTTASFRLDVAPNPIARFSYWPGDPSSLDTVQFSDESYDPANVGISSQVWTFGDGTTASGCCPTHRYARDGDYTVGLTVTTQDGRTATTSQVVQVRTHDVAIVQVALPNSAHVGQTIAVNVYLKNSRYPETVQLDLLRSGPGGFQQVATLTQPVLVRPPGGNSTRFAFTYTITDDDRTVGKVSFKAVATIIGQRDVRPEDNELTSSPVKIA
jgi:hypothetical protein